MTRIEELESIYCELHKDVYGVKARWIKFASEEEGIKALDALEAAGKEVWERERQAQEAAGAAVEAKIKELIEMGAKDRTGALRWLHEAHDTNGDDEYLCYHLGLRYGYFKVDAAAS